jgi:ferrochelatase
MSQLYEAVLVVSFGGPEGREEVIPFLENVLRGRNVPRERLLEVADHYYQFDGVSPINEQNRRLVAALQQELSERGPRLPVYWGNRNWHPFLADTIRRMAEDGIRRALAFITSAYSSYSGCRQYREDIARARNALGQRAPKIDKLRVFFNHPNFVKVHAERVQEALLQLPAELRSEAALVFTAHSIPTAMAANCRYQEQLLETSRLVAEALGRPRWDLVFQSRSGPPQQPWLEPDVRDFLKDLAGRGVRAVVLSPIGFVSDHLEVIYDLDTEARRLCAELGLQMVRSATPGLHPDFVSMIRELILERMNQSPIRRYLGTLGPGPDFCPVDCCLPA